MKTYHLLPLIIGLLNSHAACARFVDDSSNYWQCSAVDRYQQEWTIESSYERVAINKALQTCKAQSQVPESCQVAKEYCEAFVHGVSAKPMWKCTALDDRAKPWVSNIYSNQDDAAIAALAYCKEKSASPMSCYINMVTCRNINKVRME
jgi:hypothetical protein